MNRRAFFGAIGVLLTAPAVALATRFAPSLQPMRDISSAWLGHCWETPNGEPITGMQKAFGRLFVFTPSAMFELVLT